MLSCDNGWLSLVVSWLSFAVLLVGVLTVPGGILSKGTGHLLRTRNRKVAPGWNSHFRKGAFLQCLQCYGFPISYPDFFFPFPILGRAWRSYRSFSWCL